MEEVEKQGLTYEQVTKPKSRRKKKGKQQHVSPKNDATNDDIPPLVAAPPSDSEDDSDDESDPNAASKQTTETAQAPTPPKRRKSTRQQQRRAQQQQAAAINAQINALPEPPPPEVTMEVDAYMAEYWALHGTAINPDTGLPAEYEELSKCSDGDHWINSNTDEFGCLAQGLGPDSDMPTGTDTIFFMHPRKTPAGRTATYLRTVCADRPEKVEERRVRHTIGGDRIDYPGNKSTKTADMTTVKILANSVMSTNQARFMTGDLKDFYLGTPLDRYEYVRISLKVIPQRIIDLHNLMDIAVNGFVYAEVRRGMCGLPQAGILANKQLQRKLEPHGYRPVPITPGLWTHDTRDIKFALVVDDFGVKHTQRPDAEHLMTTLKDIGCAVTEDWEGERHCGLTFKWDYDKQNRRYFHARICGTCTSTLPTHNTNSRGTFTPHLEPTTMRCQGATC